MINIDDVNDIVLLGMIRDAQAKHIRALEAENHLLKTSGIAEVAVRNPNVMEYMKHWEGRAEAAEAKLAKAVKSLEAIEDASRFFARDRESSDTETLSYAHETTRRLCATTLAELSSVSCANLKGDNQ